MSILHNVMRQWKPAGREALQIQSACFREVLRRHPYGESTPFRPSLSLPERNLHQCAPFFPMTTKKGHGAASWHRLEQYEKRSDNEGGCEQKFLKRPVGVHGIEANDSSQPAEARRQAPAPFVCPADQFVGLLDPKIGM